MHAKRKKKQLKAALPEKMTFPKMVKARIVEQQEKGTRAKGKKKRDTFNLTLPRSK